MFRRLLAGLVLASLRSRRDDRGGDARNLRMNIEADRRCSIAHLLGWSPETSCATSTKASPASTPGQRATSPGAALGGEPRQSALAFFLRRRQVPFRQQFHRARRQVYVRAAAAPRHRGGLGVAISSVWRAPRRCAPAPPRSCRASPSSTTDGRDQDDGARRADADLSIPVLRPPRPVRARRRRGAGPDVGGTGRSASSRAPGPERRTARASRLLGWRAAHRRRRVPDRAERRHAISMYQANDLDIVWLQTDTARRVLRDAALRGQLLRGPAAQINYSA